MVTRNVRDSKGLSVRVFTPGRLHKHRTGRAVPRTVFAGRQAPEQGDGGKCVRRRSKPNRVLKYELEMADIERQSLSHCHAFGKRLLRCLFVYRGQDAGTMEER